MQIIPAKTPGFIKTLFPHFVWHINTDQKELFLTFDDGPTPEITPWVLQQLKEFEAKATFFCIGKNIKNHPDIFDHIISDGHAVGNHTYNHLKGWKHDTKSYIEDTENSQSLVNSILQKLNLNQERHTNDFYTTSGINLKFFRPPYGKLKTKQSRLLQDSGYKIVMWDVLSYDWDNSINHNICYNNVISTAKKGSIVVFHDSVKASPNLKIVLPKVLEYYRERGFIFRSLI